MGTRSNQYNNDGLILQVAVLSSLLTAVNRLQRAVEVCNAVLVEGPSGCGKTTIINTLAVFSEGRDNINIKPHLVTLHLGEHTDAKVCRTVRLLQYVGAVRLNVL